MKRPRAPRKAVPVSPANLGHHWRGKRRVRCALCYHRVDSHWGTQMCRKAPEPVIIDDQRPRT